MKSASNIAAKLRQVQFRHSKSEIERLLARTPGNCMWNRSIEVPAYGRLGYCSCPDLDTKACDIRTETMNRAPKCVKFSLFFTEEAARESVKAFFKESAPSVIAAKYPDVAALSWVLGEDSDEPVPDVFLAGEIEGVKLWSATEQGASVLRTWEQRFQEEADKAALDQQALIAEIEALKLDLRAAEAAREDWAYKCSDAQIQVRIKEQLMTAVEKENDILHDLEAQKDAILQSQFPSSFFGKVLGFFKWLGHGMKRILGRAR